MNFRFLKKLSGEKVLQQYSPVLEEWRDIPMEEEKVKTGMELLTEAYMDLVSNDKYRGKFISIILSEEFYARIVREEYNKYTVSVKKFNTIFGMPVAVADMKKDFKFVVEV